MVVRGGGGGGGWGGGGGGEARARIYVAACHHCGLKGKVFSAKSFHFETILNYKRNLIIEIYFWLEKICTIVILQAQSTEEAMLLETYEKDTYLNDDGTFKTTQQGGIGSIQFPPHRSTAGISSSTRKKHELQVRKCEKHFNLFILKVSECHRKCYVLLFSVRVVRCTVILCVFSDSTLISTIFRQPPTSSTRTSTKQQ